MSLFSSSSVSHRRWIRRGILTLAGAAALGAAVAAPASAAQTFYPDPYRGCFDNNPYAAQVRDAGWVSQFEGIGGTGPNGFTCRYLVRPAARFSWPIPFEATTPVDWASMCPRQFPGSHLVWAGPGHGSAGSGWVCQS